MTNGPEDSSNTPDAADGSGKKKRKVPKTMIFGVDLPPEATAAGAEPEKAEKKRKVPKTLLFDTTSAMEAAVMQAAAEADRTSGESAAVPAAQSAPEQTDPTQAEPEVNAAGTKRKVPKTLLFDTAALKDKAAEIDAAAEVAAAPSPEQPLEPVVEAPPEQPEEGKKRKVAKTLLFNPTDVVEAADAAAEAEVITEAAPVDNDAPILDISGPQVKLFFEEDSPAPAQAESIVEPQGEPVSQVQPELKVESKPEPASVSEPEPEKPKRRVPKTLLFNPKVDADGQDVPEQPSGASEIDDANAPRKVSTRKIAKTLLYSKPISVEDIVAASMAQQEAPLDEAEAERVVERYIARTMLDHSILFDQLTKSQHHMQEKAEEAAKERANEPFVPFIPIECKKEALPCPFTWDPTYSSEKYRYCDKCQRPVYNFAGLQLEDAEELVLKAENRARFTLFKRTDGLFMTSDCPVAVKRRSDLILMSVGGFLVAFCLVIYMMLLPKPPAPKPAPAPVATTPRTKHPTVDIKGVPAVPGTSGHWQRNKGVEIYKQPVTPPPVVQPPPVPEPDEQPIWEYSNGQRQ